MIETSLIDKMSVVERLQAMEQIWDALVREDGGVTSPEWHRTVLADRKARAERGETKFLTLAQLRSRLRGSQPRQSSV
jgi:putative addiction module component (TIGR02574 family)